MKRIVSFFASLPGLLMAYAAIVAYFATKFSAFEYAHGACAVCWICIAALSALLLAEGIKDRHERPASLILALLISGALCGGLLLYEQGTSMSTWMAMPLAQMHTVLFGVCVVYGLNAWSAFIVTLCSSSPARKKYPQRIRFDPRWN